MGKVVTLAKLFSGIALTMIFGNWLSMIPTGTIPFIILFKAELNTINIVIITTLYIIGLGVGLYLTYSERHSLIAINVSKKNATPRKCMLIFLSKPNPDYNIEKRDNKIVIFNNNIRIELDAQLDKLKDDISKLDRLGRSWNWQQLLRSFIPYQSAPQRLEYICFITSKESSIKIDKAKLLINAYFPNTIIDYKYVIDFNNYEIVIEYLDEIINELTKRYNEKDIIVDITGGTKISSIAGASVTLNKKVTFQYVDTNEPYTVYEFNAMHWLR